MKASELKQKSQPIKEAEIKKKPEQLKAQEGVKQEETKKPKRPPKTRSLLCELISKEKQKVYNKDSQFFGSYFYKMRTRNIENMENDAPSIVYAFKETIINPEEVNNEAELKKKEEVWRIIERDEFLGRRYIVYCYYVPMGYGKHGYKIYDLLERPKDK